MLEHLSALLRKPERRVLGLMSGTSMDGVDAALVRIRGGGTDVAVTLESFRCHPYEATLRDRLLRAASGEALPTLAHAELDFAVAAAFAQAALDVIDAAGLTPAAVDLIGSHGQTLAHRAGGPGEWDPHAATWQAGDLGVLAALVGVPVIGNFRTADIALGGTGAPLVPYADFLLRRSATESRLVLNVGGIANFTYLRSGCDREDVCGWDVGPGNMVLDGLARTLLGRDMDADGAEAARGEPAQEWVAALLRDDFFTRPAPKAAGREEFGGLYVERFLSAGRQRGLGNATLLRSAVELTARAVALACAQPPLVGQPLDAVYVTGGGRRNPTLMRRLAELLAPARVLGLEVLGIDTDAKEAVDFALLAHESLLGHAGNLVQVTGAQRPCILGSLALAGFPIRPPGAS